MAKSLPEVTTCCAHVTIDGSDLGGGLAIRRSKIVNCNSNDETPNPPKDVAKKYADAHDQSGRF